jgi:hypothetical protein
MMVPDGEKNQLKGLIDILAAYSLTDLRTAKASQPSMSAI